MGKRVGWLRVGVRGVCGAILGGAVGLVLSFFAHGVHTGALIGVCAGGGAAEYIRMIAHVP